MAALQLAVARPDTTITQEFRFRHKDNSWRRIESVARSLLHDPDIAGVVVNSRDVTDRRLAEQALRESEQRFRHLFEGSPDAIFVEDLDGLVLDANPAAGRLHGLTREDLIGRNALELIPAEKRGPERRAFEKLVRGELHQVESRTFAAHGREVPVEIRTSRIDYNGKAALLLHVRDISERKKAEEALRRSETRFHSVWENSVDGMRLTDETGTIVAVNEAFCRLVGWSREELEGKPVNITQTDGDAPENSLANHQKRFQERALDRRVPAADDFSLGQHAGSRSGQFFRRAAGPEAAVARVVPRHPGTETAGGAVAAVAKNGGDRAIGGRRGA